MKVKISKIPICMYSPVRYNMALIKYKGGFVLHRDCLHAHLTNFSIGIFKVQDVPDGTETHIILPAWKTGWLMSIH